MFMAKMINDSGIAEDIMTQGLEVSNVMKRRHLRGN